MPVSASAKTARKPVRQARQARSKATVETILEAAARILSDRGWQGLNTNAIARRAGVSVGSLYEYFPHKQAILDVLIDRHLSRAEALLEAAATQARQGMSWRSVPAYLAVSFISLHQDDPQLHRVLSSEVPVTPDQRRRVADVRARAVDLVAGLLSGQVDSPTLTASVLVDTADALAHRWIIDGLGSPVSSEIMLTELTTLLANYISAKATPVET